MVEVQTTVSMVPVKNECFRMIVHLQAIAMLDNKPSLVSWHGPKKREFILTMFYRKQTHIDSSPTYEHRYSKCTSNKKLDIATQTMSLMRRGGGSTIWLWMTAIDSTSNNRISLFKKCDCDTIERATFTIRYIWTPSYQGHDFSILHDTAVSQLMRCSNNSRISIFNVARHTDHKKSQIYSYGLLTHMRIHLQLYFEDFWSVSLAM